MNYKGDVGFSYIVRYYKIYIIFMYILGFVSNLFIRVKLVFKEWNVCVIGNFVIFLDIFVLW